MLDRGAALGRARLYGDPVASDGIGPVFGIVGKLAG
jgi:hypothetical protein